MKVNGKMINRVEEVQKYGKMVLNMMENIKKARNMDMGIYFLRMDPSILDNFLKIRYMEMENIHGLMENPIMVNGKTIKWMDMVL